MYLGGGVGDGSNFAFILKSCGRVFGKATEFFLIGSQAVRTYGRRAPAEVLISQECDLYPKNRPRMADVIDGQPGGE